MRKVITLLLSVFAIAMSVTGCSDDTPDVVSGTAPDPNATFIVDEKDMLQNVDAAGGTLYISIYTSLAPTQWNADCGAGWVSVSKGSAKDGRVTMTVSVSPNTGTSREATLTVGFGTKKTDILIRQAGSDDIPVEGDYRIRVTGAKASSEQPGSGLIGNSYDDDLTTLYHSHWSNTQMPVTLEYYFDGTEEMDYIEYVPRVEGTNGNFGKFTLYVATDASRSNYTTVGDYDFNESTGAGRVFFDKSIKATAVRFVVQSGTGNFASCAEMRFWRKNTDKTFEKQLLEVFEDVTCSSLKPGVSRDAISSISSELFRNLALSLLDNTYDPVEKMIRIHEYEPYSDPIEWSRKLMTKIYTNLDNPMGVHVKKGDRIVICVGPTHGHSLSVMCIGEHQPASSSDYAIPDASGPSYFVTEGVNVLDMTSDGQLFLIYTADPSEPKIKVHIPAGNNGSFAGYFDLKEHATDDMYRKIVAKATHKYFVVRGERMMFMFHRANLSCPSMVNAITTWDRIVKWQQDFMGIDDVRPAQWNNHLMGVSMEGSYMWASNYRMGFINTYLHNILDYDNLNAAQDNAWGPSHEMGHVNQPAINWMSTTESSNNLFSNYVLYRFGKYKSRGKGLMHRFKAVYELGECWANFGIAAGEGIYQGEDAELHMRMNWQLWNYYHRVLGDEKFFSRVFKRMRDTGLGEYDSPGRRQMEFAKACSDAAGANLTDFFAAWGFMRPVNTTVNQYGTYSYVVTQSMIDEAKTYMARYPKPKHAFEYIEDRQVSDFASDPSDYRYATVGDVGHYTTYAANKKLSSDISAVVSGRSVTVNNGREAVAFEIREVNADGSYGEIRYASNFLTFTIPAGISLSGTAIYAVQADGTRHKL